MSFSRIINDIDSHLKLGEKKKEALRNLLACGRISQNTFDLLEKGVSRVTSIVSDLKKALEKEEAFWRSSLSEETRILESLLVELEHKRLLGEIREEEWAQKNRIIYRGLNSLKNKGISTSKITQETAPPIQTPLEEHTADEIGTRIMMTDKPEPWQEISGSREDVSTRNIRRPVGEGPALDRRKMMIKEPPGLEKGLTSEAHCMNPWKPGCRNTDINLSIYYNGRMIPICSRCWEEIANRNVEWSSL